MDFSELANRAMSSEKVPAVQLSDVWTDIISK